MAFIKYCNDGSGVEYPDAYWRPDSISLEKRSKLAVAVFVPYLDAQAAAADWAPLAGVSPRVYSAQGEEFIDLYTRHVAPGGPNIAALAYALALSTLDDQAADGTPASFFKDAKIL